jgi:hypothetical protein
LANRGGRYSRGSSSSSSYRPYGHEPLRRRRAPKEEGPDPDTAECGYRDAGQDDAVNAVSAGDWRRLQAALAGLLL